MSDDMQQDRLTIEQVEAMIAAVVEPDADPFLGDDDATWVYWTPLDTAERGVPDEWVWERLRIKRDSLLAACDFRVVPDAPWETAPWIAYRQALRDLPDTTTDPRTADWPIAPDAEGA